MKPNPYLARRQFLQDCRIGIGKIAAAGLLANGMSRSATGATQDKLLAPKQPHFNPTAKAVIHLFMAGAPSQLELFDEKPTLSKLEGQPLPKSIIGDQRYAFIQSDAAVMGPRFKFAKYGKSGISLGSPMAPLGAVVDDLCFIKSVTTDQFNHAPAQLFFNSGSSQLGRPCLGSWALYGLGAETEDLPAFVVMNTGAGLSGGTSLWSSGFLTPEKFSAEVQQDTFDLISKLNKQRLGVVGDPEISTRMSSFEMAARLQTSAPDLMDLSDETKETIELYGCDPAKASFSRACLLARRMVQRGVRFINIYHSGWDAHSDVEGSTKSKCKETVQGCAALIQDLKRTGLLDSTLVIWGGEFGRTPMVETNPALSRKAGRDHHPQAFTMWMAGGGIKAGMTYGETDEFGFHIVDKKVHVHDLQATILHTMGFDHERLTYHHAGRDFRLTDVHGNVVKDLLA